MISKANFAIRVSGLVCVCEGVLSTASLYDFLLPVITPFREQKEEKTSKRSKPAAMFPCFSSPAVCARATHERGVRNVDTVLW